MGVIWNKIWYDLWKHKSRLAQVVLIIATGAFAIGMIITARTLAITRLTDGWRAAAAPMIDLGVEPAVDDDVIAGLKRIDGVKAVEGLTVNTIEWRRSPTDSWQAATLIARADYDHMQYFKLDLLEGQWPTDDRAVIGQGFNVPNGAWVSLKVNDRVVPVQVVGEVYNPTGLPVAFGGDAEFFITRDRLAQLTGNHDFNRIFAGAPAFDEAKVNRLFEQMDRKLQKQNVDAVSAAFTAERIADPAKHFFADVLDGLFMVMGIMAVLALILGLFLVYNTINALIAQQIDQIGIMKAIGASTGQIVLIYFLNVLIYGGLSLFIALPLSALAGWGLSAALVGAFNINPGQFTIVPAAVIVQIAIALIAPLLAALLPILSGASITVREAINTYGLSAGVGLLERGLNKLTRLSRILVLTISNTFRHKGRVILTQITLVLSGLIFMMVMSVRDAADYTFGNLLFDILRFDINLTLERPERIEEVEALALAHPDVKAVEMWAVSGLSGTTVRPASQPATDDDKDTILFGVPLPTKLYGPQVRQGRWLLPGENKAVVLNQQLAEDIGVGVGDWVTFDHGLQGETTWQVVGLIFDPIIVNSAHVSREALLPQLDSVGKAGTIWIQTVSDDPAFPVASSDRLRAYFEAHQIDVSPLSLFNDDTATEIKQQVNNNFGVIIYLLATMAVVIGVVGSIALSGVLSLNVMERRREIGVMRAIGASSGTITRIFVGEGVILGLLSWLIAFPLSLPAGRLMTTALSAALGGEIVYRYTPTGALLWLAIITILSIAASWLPARGASRISVRQSLAYQ